MINIDKIFETFDEEEFENSFGDLKVGDTIYLKKFYYYDKRRSSTKITLFDNIHHRNIKFKIEKITDEYIKSGFLFVFKNGLEYEKNEYRYNK